MYSVNYGLYGLYGATAANPGKGVLTVNVDGTWGTVCDNDFVMKDAEAACRGLGYHHAISESNVGSNDSYNCRKSYERYINQLCV